ncbi:hypothetical protein PVAP13_4KG113110 [Panicum virgatum]|uniref:Uncharacterized protein n=1 Tax=Panicum virgatum TaxID=38727 RepID=A0A8T0TIS6_PANVG|nr:hypothetical protein PVAP13_4KG113110 [Panicum virgatum]
MGQLHPHPRKILNNDNGDVALDMYHRYKGDMQLLKDMNMDSFRFSIAWSRILPNGSLSGGINKEGVAFYNNLIKEVIAKGLRPFVTIFHWDTPLALEEKYGGFFSEKIMSSATFNEPWTYAERGYAAGAFAPGRCSPHVSRSCFPGDSAREPYVVTHHILLAHAEAVALYRARYQKAQRGQIGITLVSHWFVPATNSSADRAAVRRSLDFMYGWYLDPIVHGAYPASMAGYLGARLPGEAQVDEIIKEPKPTEPPALDRACSYDFIGVNYYTTYFTSAAPPADGLRQSYDTDARASTSGFRDGMPIGPKEFVSVIFNYPAGVREILLYTSRWYGNPVMYVTENGIAEGNNAMLPLAEVLKDGHRIEFHSKHLHFVNHAIWDDTNVKGYFTWTFMDCFKWGDGYLDRFGLIFIDRINGLKRYRKESSYWIENFLRACSVTHGFIRSRK